MHVLEHTAKSWNKAEIAKNEKDGGISVNGRQTDTFVPGYVPRIYTRDFSRRRARVPAKIITNAAGTTTRK